MAHPFPGKVEIIPKRRRKSPIGVIGTSSDVTSEESDNLNKTRDAREAALVARELRFKKGRDLFRSLLLRNLNHVSVDIYKNEGQENEVSDDSDADSPKSSQSCVSTNPVDPSADRNNFVGFKQFRLSELVRQLKQVSRSASPNDLIEYDVSSDDDEESITEVSIKPLPVTDRACHMKSKGTSRIPQIPVEFDPPPSPPKASQVSTTRTTKNSRRNLDVINQDEALTRVLDESKSKVVSKSISKSKKPEKSIESRSKLISSIRSKSRTSKSEMKSDVEEVIPSIVVAVETDEKLNQTEAAEKVKEVKVVKKTSIKDKKKRKKVQLPEVVETVKPKEKIETVTKKESKKKKIIKKDNISNSLSKKLYQKAVKNATKKAKSEKVKSSTESVKTAEKVLDKKEAVAKGLAAIKSIWKERLSKLSKSESNNSDSVAQNYSPALSLSVLPVSEHSSINSPRTPSILREARLQVDTSKLSPLVLTPKVLAPNHSSQSSSSSSSSSDSSDSEEEQKIVKKVVPKKKRTKITAISKSSSKKRPGEIICVICNVTKFYSHKQRRFGQYSCESCSKFFYYFIKTPTAYFCDNHGDCKIGSSTPVSSRCRACWLKICLQTYTIPDETRNNLSKNNFLPKLSSAPHVSLISIDTANVNHHDDSIPQIAAETTTNSVEKKANGRNKRTEQCLEKKDEHSDGLLMMVPTVGTKIISLQQPSPAMSSPGSQNSPQQPSPAPKSLKDIRVKRGKVVFAPKESPETPNAATTTVQVVSEMSTSNKFPSKQQSRSVSTAASNSKSKSLNISQPRGPRTKNVCRTSITGLPVATFGSIGDEDEQDDLGASEENVDSDDSDNLPLHDYIWKVIAEDRAARGENDTQDSTASIKPSKKSKSKSVTNADNKSNESKSKKAKEIIKNVSNGQKKSQVRKAEKPKLEKSTKVTFAPKKQSSRKNSVITTDDVQAEDTKVMPNSEKTISPCVPNLNSDTDIEDVEEEKPIKVVKPQKVKKRKLTSDIEPDSKPNEVAPEKKSKKSKKVKIVTETEIEKVEPLIIKTSSYCSCPVPILKTPPDQVVEVPNGNVVQAAPDVETPVKKKSKKSASKDKSKRQSTDLDTSIAAPDQPVSSAKKKKITERSPSSDRARARKRCNECTGCTADDCGTCAPCKDKKKFGGPGIRKQACKMRRCLSLFHCGPSPPKMLNLEPEKVINTDENKTNDEEMTEVVKNGQLLETSLF